jgi:tight adherence protein B
MEPLLIGVVIFVICVVVIELLIYSAKIARSPNRGMIRKRLRKHTFVEDNDGSSDIIKKRVFSDISFLNNVLLKTPGVQKLDDLISSANTRFTLGFFILLTILITSLGFMLGVVLFNNKIITLVLPPIFGCFPFLYLIYLKQKRMQKFKTQMPEALELISRALKAGHALTGAMRLAADEFEDPLGPEFAETLDEINFGVSVPEALKNLSKRIDLPEMKYFVIGIILQRETGGNLAELMDTLANLVREKFKFEGKVKTLSAEGKLSAVVLVCLPFAIIAYLKIAQPKYMNLLFSDPIGKVMTLVAGIMMIIGIFVMKQMIKIEV